MNNKFRALDVAYELCKADENEFLKLGKEIYGKGNCPPALLPWVSEIQLPSPTCEHNKRKSIFNVLTSTLYNRDLWALVMYSMPPLFHDKYYHVNVEDLVTHTQDSNYIALSCVLTLWHESYGLPLLNLLHKKHQVYDVKNTKTKVEMDQWSADNVNIIKYLRLSWEGMDIDKYTGHDLGDDAVGFILDPNVIIQLPWQPILLHQWLAAVLFQVITLEHGLIEMKHEALTVENVQITRKLVNMTIQLKERVLLGFAILNEQVTSYPKTNNKHPEYIMDVVVLPSVPILEFIFSDGFRTIVKYLQNHIPEHGKKLYYIHEDTYKMDPALAQLHVNFMYNFKMWTSKNIPSLFPCVPDKIEVIIDRMKREKANVNPHLNNITKPLSLEEECLLDYIKTHYEYKRGEEVQVTINLICELIKINSLKGVTIHQVKKTFDTPKNKKKCREIFNLSIKDDDVLNAIRQGVMWQYTCHMLMRPDRLNDIECVAFQTIVMQLQLLQVEQAMRIANTCKMIFNIKTNEKSTARIDIPQVNKHIEEICTKVQEQNRESLWSKLPQEWRKPMDEVLEEEEVNNDTDPNYEDIDEDEALQLEAPIIFKTIENRIGRLLYHIAINSFEVVGNGFQVFPLTNYIQYILPSMLGALYEKYQNSGSINKNYLQLIYSLLDIFENKFQFWLANPTPKMDTLAIPEPPRYYRAGDIDTPIAFQIKDEWPTMNMKMREIARQITGCKIHECYYFTVIFGIDKIINNTHNYANFLSNEPVCVDFVLLFNKLYETGYTFTYFMIEAAMKAYEIPIAGSTNKFYPQYSELYFVSTVLSELQTLFEITKMYIDPTDPRSVSDSQLETEIEAMFTDDLKILRYDIFIRLLDPDEYEYSMRDFIHDSIPVLRKLYLKLKEYRTFRSALQARLINLLPYSKLENSSARFKSAIWSYISGNFRLLDMKMRLIVRPVKIARRRRKFLHFY